jgi:hypothetical protein
MFTRLPVYFIAFVSIPCTLCAQDPFWLQVPAAPPKTEAQTPPALWFPVAPVPANHDSKPAVNSQTLWEHARHQKSIGPDSNVSPAPQSTRAPWDFSKNRLTKTSVKDRSESSPVANEISLRPRPSTDERRLPANAEPIQLATTNSSLLDIDVQAVTISVPAKQLPALKASQVQLDTSKMPGQVENRALPNDPVTPEKVKSFSRVAAQAGKDEPESTVPVEVIQFQKKDVDSPTNSTQKFETSTMIGPLADASNLFAGLAISDRFETTASVVNADRTREMDAPGQVVGMPDAYTWISPVFYHKPLYFEQPNLERYGVGTNCRLQPAASAIHFFGTIPLLPYKILTQHPCEKYYTLGNNRPGDCVPVQRNVILGQSYFGEARQYWASCIGY